MIINKLFKALTASSITFVSSVNFCGAMNNHQINLDMNKKSQNCQSQEIEMQGLKPVTIFDITRDKVEEINLQVPTDSFGIICNNTGAEFRWSDTKDEQIEKAMWGACSPGDEGDIYVYFGCSSCDTNPDMLFPPRSGSDFLKVVARATDVDPGRYFLSVNCAMAEMRDWGKDPGFKNFYLNYTCLGDDGGLGQKHVNDGHIYVIVTGEIDEKPIRFLNRDWINVIVNKFQECLCYCLNRCDRYHHL